MPNCVHVMDKNAVPRVLDVEKLQLQYSFHSITFVVQAGVGEKSIIERLGSEL